MKIKEKLHALQAEIVLSPARFRVSVCGRRWGKTLLGASLALEAACRGRRVWWVGPTYAQSSIAWRALLPLAAIPGSTVHRSERRLELPTGGEIWFKSADLPDNLRGEGLDLLIMDEADYQDGSTWRRVLRPALADRRGKALFISTPRLQGGWFHELFKRGQSEEGRARGWASWQNPSSSNPHLAAAEIEEARDDLDPLEFRREFGAEFVSAPDTVYHLFSEDHHVGSYPFSPGKKVWIGVDFNNRPMSAVFCQLHGDVLWVVGETAEDGTTEQHGARIAAWLKARGVLPEQGRFPSHLCAIVPDASGSSRQHAAGKSDHQILREAGFSLEGPLANPAIKDRDNAVLRLLESASGVRRVFFDASCKKTREAFRELREIGRDRSPFTHLTDAAGYVAMRLFPIQAKYLAPDPAAVASLGGGRMGGR